MKKQKLEVNLLGTVQFKVDGVIVSPLPTRAGQALFIYLLHQPHPINREQLMDWFFQGSSFKQARANLRGTISRLKKQFPGVIDANRAEVWIKDDCEIVLDSRLFENLAQQETDSEQNKLTQVVAHYKGEFMAGFYLREAPEFNQWLMVERERLRLLVLEGLQALSRLLIESAEFKPALRALNRLLAIEPLLENAHRNKMLMLARTGQREAALLHYRSTTNLFQNELGIELSETTDLLLQRIQALKFPPDFVIPKARRQFIGRTQETNQLIRALLQPQRRLITLLGQGGVGKTRLSQAVAHDLFKSKSGLFLDGIYFVELIAQKTLDDVAQNIAQVMSVKLRGTQPPFDQLITYLQDKEALLILDNFDHLVQDSAETGTGSVPQFISDIINVCENVKLLVTSRERLRLYEETVLEIGGLPLIGTYEKPSEAEQLFISNAQQHSLTFTTTAHEHSAIQTICGLVDGVPLAIELAAGWLPHHDVANIAIQIQHSLDFLKTTLRNVPQRQRSLRAVFFHSWNLLEAKLQPLFANLSVFPDSFSLEAAAEIVGVDQIILTNLANKSLVQIRDDGRFALHPLIKQFAWEQVTDKSDLRWRHANFFTGQIKALCSDATISPETTHQILRPNFENVRQGWQTTIQQANWQTIETIAHEMGRYFLQIERVDEGYTLFEDALKVCEKDPTTPKPSMVQAQLNFYQGRFANWNGHLDRGTAKLETCLEIAQRLEDDRYIGRSLANLGFTSYRTGDYEQSRSLSEKAIEISTPIDDDYALMTAYSGLGNALMALGEFNSAEKALLTTIERREHMPESISYALCLSNLGYFYNFIRAPEKAADALSKSLEILKLNDYKSGIGLALLNYAETLVQLERYDEAIELLTESYHLRKEVNDKRGLLATVSDLASTTIKQNNFAAAKPYLTEAFELSIGATANRRILMLISELARYHKAVGNWASAALFSAYIGQQEATHAGLFDRVEPILKTAPDHLSAENLATISSKAESLTYSSAVKQALASLA